MGYPEGDEKHARTDKTWAEEIDFERVEQVEDIKVSRRFWSPNLTGLAFSFQRGSQLKGLIFKMFIRCLCLEAELSTHRAPPSQPRAKNS